MEFVVWHSSYCIGEPTIDRQHQELVRLINLLHQKIHGGFCDRIIDEVLIRLINYAENHFRDEEEFMKAKNYPEYEEHRKEHERLVMEVFEFKRRYDKREVSKFDLLLFLRDWLINHILDTDLKLKHWAIN